MDCKIVQNGGNRNRKAITAYDKILSVTLEQNLLCGMDEHSCSTRRDRPLIAWEAYCD
jgi:hypothetical protein